MKLSFFALFFFAQSFSLASPPPPDGVEYPPFFYSPPRGGGITAKADVFRLALATTPCDRGYHIEVIRSPGLVALYRLEATEITRGACPSVSLSGEVVATGQVERAKAEDGSLIFSVSPRLALSDRTEAKVDRNLAWVAVVNGVYYQASLP